MAYGKLAKFIRRCTVAMKDGTRCTKCTCKAYPFPHRPGGGLCNWPHEANLQWKSIPGMRPKPDEGEPWPATIEAVSDPPQGQRAMCPSLQSVFSVPGRPLRMPFANRRNMLSS